MTKKNSNGGMSVKTIVMTALMAALTCIATMVIHIPTPGTGGYVNLGDGFVITSAVLLGPGYGFLAGGIGSMLADLLSGYPTYAPGTFVIKGLAALVSGFVYLALTKHVFERKKPVAVVISAIASGAVVTGGYFLYESTLLGYGMGAAASIPANLLQNLAGLIIAVLLCPVLSMIQKQAQNA